MLRVPTNRALAHMACHVTGCRLTQEPRVQDDLDDVASNIWRAVPKKPISLGPPLRTTRDCPPRHPTHFEPWFLEITASYEVASVAVSNRLTARHVIQRILNPRFSN